MCSTSSRLERGTEYKCSYTHSVVKFMVNVKLIENKVNKEVGRVIVANVITQYRTLGMTWKKNRKKRPMKPAIGK